MVEFSKLQRNFVSRLTLTPYKDVTKFPVVRNTKGDMEQIDESWKGVEFTCVTPNTAIIEKIEHLESEVSIVGGLIAKPKAHAKDAMKYVCDSIIKGWNILEDNEPVKYDADWLYKYFFHIPWLYRHFISEYKKSVGTIPLEDSEAKGEEESFLYEQENTVIIVSEDTEQDTNQETDIT